MLKDSDLKYYRMRERNERLAADSATSRTARTAHNALARHYADRVWALEQRARSREGTSSLRSSGPLRKAKARPARPLLHLRW